MSEPPHVVVAGGGIAGLSAADALLRDGARVTLLEADRRLGGKLRSERIDGVPVDVGAESLLARMPSGVELCRDLGLDGELVAPQRSELAVWARGRLRELPGGLLGGLPGGVAPLLRAGILSPRGVARASLDLLLPAAPDDGDRSVGELVGDRLGRQVVDRLVEPLLASIYAVGCEELSAGATAPQLVRLAAERRSLIRGMLAATPPPADAGPPLLGLRGGMERLVDQLRERLGEAELRRGVEVTWIEREGDGYRVCGPDLGALRADGVVVAVPAAPAARMLCRASPATATLLLGIEYASVVVVTLRYRGAAAPRPLSGAGFVVPRSAGRLLGACGFLSAKWPHLRESGDVWLRCTVGPAATARALAMPDEKLVELLAAELREVVGLRGRPLRHRVTRWRRALPRYAPGHLQRIERIDAEIAGLPGIALAGAAYRGMSVPQCIASGQAAADRVIGALDARQPAMAG